MVILDHEGDKINQNKSIFKGLDDTFKDKEKVESFKRKAIVIRDISISSMMQIMEDQKTHTVAAGVGLIQGLKYGGSLSRGIKGGIAAYGVMIGANVIHNVIQNREVIRKA